MVTEQPRRDVRLLCGPPGAGKSTFARATGLDVYDLDDPQWHGSERLFRQAISALAGDPTAQAIVIRSGARARSRRIWANLIRADTVLVMATTEKECQTRVIQRGRPRPPMHQQLAAVTRWWREYQEPELDQRGPRSREW